jgi:MazG family protein
VSDIDHTDIRALLDIMARLRDPDTGCPWDVAQDFATIAPYTIEEAYEVADAIARRDLADLRDELGDLLFQVVFHARMAEEQGEFAFPEVVQGIVDKMIRRHPHVFADASADDAESVRRSWEDIKAAERGERGGDPDPFDGVSPGMPALQRAEKLQRRASRHGFDWRNLGPVRDKLHEEVAELEREIDEGGSRERLRAELGDVLFSVVNLSRHLELDAEGALVEANARFEARFRCMTEAAGGSQAFAGQGEAELDRMWQAAKLALAKI